MSATIYHPKGSMCLSCKNRDQNCSDLNFRKMRATMTYSKGKDPTKYVSVICAAFDKV